MLSAMFISVLIVDGDRWKRETFAAALSYEGYRAEHTGDGAAALALVARHPYQLVLLDLSTPATGRWKTIEQMVLLRPDLPVIVLAPAEEQRLAPSSMAGAAAATALPTNVSTLLRTMRRALSRPAATYVVRLIERKSRKSTSPLRAAPPLPTGSLQVPEALSPA